MDPNKKNGQLNKRYRIFWLLILIFTASIFFTDSDFNKPETLKMIGFGLISGLILAVLLYLLNKNRPDLFKKWFSADGFMDQLSKDKNSSDLKSASTVFIKWYADTTVMGIIAGIVVLSVMFIFVWYAKSYLGWP